MGYSPVLLDKEMSRFRLSDRVTPHNRYRRLAELTGTFSTRQRGRFTATQGSLP